MKISNSDLQKLAAMENKRLSVEQVIEFNFTANEVKLVIDYTKTIEQAIADGNYDWKNADITAKNFPISLEMIEKKIEVSIKLFNFNCDISSEDAISKIDKAGYRPATLVELLVLGFLFPELQRRFPIVALGSLWRNAFGDLCVPYLDMRCDRRKLDLNWFDDDWGTYDCFLVIRQ